MFLHLSVSHSVHRGEGGVCQHARDRDVSLSWGCLPRLVSAKWVSTWVGCLPRMVSTKSGVSAWKVSLSRGCLPRGVSAQEVRCLPRGMYTHRFRLKHPRMTIEVGSMYPIGMHSCLVLTMIFPYLDLCKNDTNWMLPPSLIQMIIMKVFLIVPRCWQVVKIRKLDLSTSRYKGLFTLKPCSHLTSFSLFY